MSTQQDITPADAYRRGYADGVAQAAAWVADHDHNEWALMRTFVRDLAKRPSFAELCERRGDHARAARQRQTLRDNGVFPQPETTTTPAATRRSTR